MERNQSISDFTMVIIFLKTISKMYMVIIYWIYYGDHFLMLIIFYTSIEKMNKKANSSDYLVY